MAAPTDLETPILREAVTNDGSNLAEISEESPILLVFLRHLGCAFCRETLGDIAERREFLRERNIRPVLVHMGKDADAMRVFRKYGLEDSLRVSDPSQNLYRAFGLGRANFWKMLNPIVWIRMFAAAVVRRHGAGPPIGDPMQMPGVFLVHRGRVIMDFRHRTIADRPDYGAFAANAGGD